MANILANSAIELNSINALLEKNIPTYRQAYSDRTAWIMSCVAELAYIRFNPLFSNSQQKDYVINGISKLIGENKQASLLKLLDTVGYDHEEEIKRLKDELSTIDMALLATFDTQGTQAILVAYGNCIVLAFRGTEATSLHDIKSDAKAQSTSCETQGRIHSGFKEAFNQVSLEIQAKLNEETFSDKQLFITGHSLGGALATIAAKKLSHRGGIAACYTFGSPRVGDDEWISRIKTPIYRLVNAADCVTMLPPSSETIHILSWGSQFIPWIGKSLRASIISNFGGYQHCGNMRYLTNCPRGQYKAVKLLYSVSTLYRMKAMIIKSLPWKKFAADHSMSIYRKKLMMIAQQRNNEDDN